MCSSDLRLGGGMSTQLTDPKAGGGIYLFVANGELDMQNKLLPRWSMVYVEPEEDAAEIRAGAKGLELLVMQFPKDDDLPAQAAA